MKKEIARKLLKNQVDKNIISASTGLSIKEIEELEKDNQEQSFKKKIFTSDFYKKSTYMAIDSSNTYKNYFIEGLLTTDDKIILIGGDEDNFCYFDNFCFSKEDIIKAFPKFKDNINVYQNLDILFRENSFYLCINDFIAQLSTLIDEDISLHKINDFIKVSVKKILLYDEDKDSFHFEDIDNIYKNTYKYCYCDEKNKLMVDFMDVDSRDFVIPEPIASSSYEFFSISKYTNFYEIKFSHLGDGFSVFIFTKEPRLSKPPKNIIKFSENEIVKLVNSIYFSIYNILDYSLSKTEEDFKDDAFDFLTKEFNITKADIHRFFKTDY